MEITNEEYMKRAITEAEIGLANGEIPIGAVIVKDGEIIAMAHNMRENNKDATDHAEILAIKEACKKLNNWRLLDCDIYVTKEPCLMCYGAILNARIRTLYYGFFDDKLISDITEKIKTGTAVHNHKLMVFGGILDKDCYKVFNKFFKR